MEGGEREGFWRFSTGLYGRPGVESAFLALQDEHGLDVPLLLFCLYAASRERTLEPALTAAMAAIGEKWERRVVAPLRAVRRELKRLAPDGALRQEVKRLELAAERTVHAELEALLSGTRPVGGGDPRALAERNLSAWFAALRIAVPEEGPLRAHLGAVLDQAFP